MNEPSKVTLDFHKLEQLFSERARLYQREEELGRLRNRLCALEGELAKLSSFDTVRISNAEDAARSEAFDEVRAIIAKFDFRGVRYKGQAKMAMNEIMRQIDAISPPF